MKISFHHHRSEASYSWSHSHASAQLIPSHYVTYTTMGCVCVLCYPPINTVAAFLDYSVSEDIDEVGEFETSGSTIISTDSRHLKNL
jgi:hypothetical protein